MGVHESDNDTVYCVALIITAVKRFIEQATALLYLFVFRIEVRLLIL
jgi:hypothetical protein